MKRILIITPSEISLQAVGAPLMLARLFSGVSPDSLTIVARDIVAPRDSRWHSNALLKYTLGNIRTTMRSVKALTQAAEAVIAKQRPDSILITSDTGSCFIAGYRLAKRYKLPYDLFIFDLWLGNFLKPFDRLLAWIYDRQIFTGARTVFAAGEGLTGHFLRSYGITAVVINNPIPKEAEAPLAIHGSPVGNPPVMLYPGSIYWAQADSIRAVSKALEGTGIELHIYTPQSAEQIARLGIGGRQVKVFPQLPSVEIIQKERASDILLVALSFSRRGRRVLNTASPGKFSEFLASGTPILAVAPAHSFITETSQNRQLALAVPTLDSNEIKAFLQRLLADSTLRKNLATRARQVALAEYTIEINASRLLTALHLYDA